MKQNFIFNIQVFHKLILTFWFCVARIRSLHIVALSPENTGDEVDFLPAGKHKLSIS